MASGETAADTAPHFTVAMQPIALPSQPYLDGLVHGLRDAGISCVPVSAGLVLRGEADVLHFHWPEFSIAGTGFNKWTRALRRLAQMRVARMRSMTLVATAHNAIPHDKSLTRFDRWYLDRFDRSIDHFFAMAESAVPDVQRLRPALAGTGWSHTRHGDYRWAFPDLACRDDCRAALEIADEGAVVSFVGAVRRYKGIPDLLSAAAGVDATVIVAGGCADEDLADEIERASNQAGNARLMLRHLTDDELVQTVRASDLIVLPYRQVLNSGSAILALSLGRPVLLPDTPTFAELAAEVGSSWVHLYSGAKVVEADITAALAAPRNDQPDLSLYDWEPVTQMTIAGYRRAMANRVTRTVR